MKMSYRAAQILVVVLARPLNFVFSGTDCTDFTDEFFDTDFTDFTDGFFGTDFTDYAAEHQPLRQGFRFSDFKRIII